MMMVANTIQGQTLGLGVVSIRRAVSWSSMRVAIMFSLGRNGLVRSETSREPESATTDSTVAIGSQQ
jgi:hypothetical protein